MKNERNVVFREIEGKDDWILAKIIRDVFEEYDVPKYGTVYSDPSTDHLYELFQTPRSAMFVAENKKGVLGGCGIFPTKGLEKNCAELVKFYLIKNARGMGIGKELLRLCTEKAKELGYDYLYLESFPEFNDAISLYIKSGFYFVHERKGESGHFACSSWMLKNL